MFQWYGLLMPTVCLFLPCSATFMQILLFLLSEKCIHCTFNTLYILYIFVYRLCTYVLYVCYPRWLWCAHKFVYVHSYVCTYMLMDILTKIYTCIHVCIYIFLFRSVQTSTWCDSGKDLQSCQCTGSRVSFIRHISQGYEGSSVTSRYCHWQPRQLGDHS